MLQHVTHKYFINFVKGLSPIASKANSGYTSLHEYVITIISTGRGETIIVIKFLFHPLLLLRSRASTIITCKSQTATVISVSCLLYFLTSVWVLRTPIAG